MTSTLIKVTWHLVAIMFLSFGGLLLMIAGMPLGEAGALAVRAIGLTFALAPIMVLWLARRRPGRSTGDR